MTGGPRQSNIPTGWYATMTTRAPTTARIKLLDAAEQLMLTRGFGATSLDRICTSVGVSKGCFFHHFKSKEVLGKATLDRAVECKQRMFQEAPFRNKRDPLQRVYGYVDFAIELSQSKLAKRGCLLGNFSQELSDTDAGMRKICAEHFAQWAESLQQDLDEAKLKHAPRARFDTHSLAEHFIAILEGALILAKTRQDPSIVKDSLSHFKRYLTTLYEK